MASSRSGMSRRKAEAPEKLRIQLKAKSAKVVSDDGDNMDDNSDAEVSVKNGTAEIEPEVVEDGSTKKKKEAPVRIDTSVLDNVGCTACGKQLNPYKYGVFQKHPELKVLICRRCEKFLNSGEITKDKDGSDEQCRWCGQGGRLVVCDECSKAFCKSCIMRNFNRSEFNNINEQKSWRCYICDKAPLQSLRENYRNVRDTLKALQARDKAKASAASNTTKTSSNSTNGTAKSRKFGSNQQGPEAESAAKGGRGNTGAAASDVNLSLEDVHLNSKGVAGLLDQLSMATNTFRDMLRALRAQFEGPGADDDSSPLHLKFTLSKNLCVQEKEQHCTKMLSKGLETYFKSLKSILVSHRASDIDSDQEKPAPSASKQGRHKKMSPKKSSVEGKADSESDLCEILDSDEVDNQQQGLKKNVNNRSDSCGKSQKKDSLNIVERTESSGPVVNKKTDKNVEVSEKSPGNNEDENEAAKRALLNEELSSHGESDEENSADKCDSTNDDENTAAKFDLLKELADKMVDDEADSDNGSDLPLAFEPLVSSDQGGDAEASDHSESIGNSKSSNKSRLTSSSRQSVQKESSKKEERSKQRIKENGKERSLPEKTESCLKKQTGAEKGDVQAQNKCKNRNPEKDSGPLNNEHESHADSESNVEQGNNSETSAEEKNEGDEMDTFPENGSDIISETVSGDKTCVGIKKIDKKSRTNKPLKSSSSDSDSDSESKGAAKKDDLEKGEKLSPTSSCKKKSSDVQKKETVVESSDLSSSDLLLSSDDNTSHSTRRRRKRETRHKNTSAQSGEKTTSKSRQTSAVKEQPKSTKANSKHEDKRQQEKVPTEKDKDKKQVIKNGVKPPNKSDNPKLKDQKPKVNGKKEEEEEKDEDEKEIERLSKLPTLRKRKAKDLDESEEAVSDGKGDQQGKKASKKSKPGPKSSKAGKKNGDFDGLSSDDEKEPTDQEEEDDEENDEMEDLPVSFSLGPTTEENEENVEDENLEAKKDLLDSIDSDMDSDKDEKEDSSASDDASDSEKKKSKASDKKKKGKGEKNEEEESATKSDENNDVSDNNEDESEKKKKPAHDDLLDAKLSDSEDSDILAIKKKKKKDEEEFKADDSSSSGSSLPSDSEEGGEDDSDLFSDEGEDGDSKKKKKKKKGKKKTRKRKGKGKGKKGSADDDDDEEEAGDDSDEEGKKGKGKKRKRIKKIADSSDEGAEDKDEDDDEKNKSGKRKQIRKVMSSKKLEDSTKAAAKAEEKRRKRIAAKQREFNIETITDENNPMDCPITTKLVLEPGKEEGDPPIVQVNVKLVRKLKPHQVDAVQFMWDCMFESVKRSKKESGAGCILAHCMGLGKTLSVISFVHTVLSHQEVLKQKTCLVVSPLNTVLNWQNEWGLWLDEEDQLDVWELASCKQNPARAATLKEWHSSGGIMIIGYEMYRNLSQGARCKNKRQKKIFFETLVDPGPDMVICDEGHILKNEASSISKAMNQMKTRRRVVLTGTPLQNNLNEYHCMLSFVKPNLLGTRREFNNRFISPIQNGQCTDSTARDVKLMKARAHVLHEMLAGCVQRRDYSALTKFLPPKQEYVISVRLTNIQIDLYNKYLELSGQGVDGVFNNKGARLFSDYQNLMKIWTHPWVLKLAEIRDEQKMKFDDEDSFIDDDSDAERSFSSSDSASEEENLKLSDSGGEGTSKGPHMKRGTRRTRAKARRQAGEDSDPEEVIAEWKSKTRLGKDDDDVKEEEPGPKSVSKEWWAAFVTEDDKNNLELSNKLFLLFEILKMCEEIGDKVLIFSQSILSLNIIESFLETVDSKFQQECEELGQEEENKDEKESFGRSWTKGLDYYRMDGSTSAQNRQLWAANFNDLENYRTRLFLISTKAGGLGINLVAANRVIIFDASWNPSHDVQSIFRVYRFGQTKPCYIYRFLAQGTMEEKIYERQVTKLSLSQRVVDEHQIERHFSANDLKELYNFKPDKWDDGTEKPTLALPKDPLLAEILTTNKRCVLSFHEHDSLLENQIEQELTEEEKKAAWDEYENEKKGIIVRGPGMERTASWPMMAAAQILSREQITATVQALRQQLPDISEDLFHLHVQQALRRQVQMKQDEMRRMEMMRQQELTYMHMIRYEAQQRGVSYEEVQAQMAPWIQMQRLRAMQTHLMAGGGMGSSGMHNSASMAMLGNMGGQGGSRSMGAGAEQISNKPEEAIDLDDN